MYATTIHVRFLLIYISSFFLFAGSAFAYHDCDPDKLFADAQEWSDTIDSLIDELGDTDKKEVGKKKKWLREIREDRDKNMKSCVKEIRVSRLEALISAVDASAEDCLNETNLIRMKLCLNEIIARQESLEKELQELKYGN